jgi:hypothetical protein
MHGVQEHFAEVIVFGLTIRFGGINAIVNWVKISAIAMHQIHYPNPTH